MSNSSQRDAFLDIHIHLEELEARIDAFQLVLGWLIHKTPDGLAFLSRQAKAVEKEKKGKKGKVHYSLTLQVEELDAIRDIAVYLDGVSGPPR